MCPLINYYLLDYFYSYSNYYSLDDDDDDDERPLRLMRSIWPCEKKLVDDDDERPLRLMRSIGP